MLHKVESKLERQQRELAERLEAVGAKLVTFSRDGVIIDRKTAPLEQVEEICAEFDIIL